MKKLISALLALVMTASAAAALLSAETESCVGNPAVPVYTEGYTYGDFDELRIRKIYQLSGIQDTYSISSENFESNGQEYHFRRMEQVSGEELELYIREKIDHSENLAFCAAVFRQVK